jgi:hypothetical protein
MQGSQTVQFLLKGMSKGILKSPGVIMLTLVANSLFSFEKDGRIALGFYIFIVE